MDKRDSVYTGHTAYAAGKIQRVRFHNRGTLLSVAGYLAAATGIMALLLTGCGNSGDMGTTTGENEKESDGGVAEGQTGQGAESPDVGIAHESAEDGRIDFGVLLSENPDIFAWIYIPGTEIDCPVLQSGTADDFYQTHDAYGNENACGAVYTEMANLTDMTDFNTVFHGKTGKGGDFTDLYRYTEPQFFDKNDKIYIFLDGNLLGYRIFAAYEREDDSLIRRYNFTDTEGCNAFLADMYARAVGKQIRAGWEGLTCNHFLITLTTKVQEDDDKQFVVIGALVEDTAGTVNREVME